MSAERSHRAVANPTIEIRERLQRLSSDQRRYLATRLENLGKVSDRESERDSLILVAYVVPSGTSKPNTPELRSFLSSNLPEFMLPSRFVWLDSLPVAPNGKVDRAQLAGAMPSEAMPAEPESEQTVSKTDDVQEKLLQIWREVLGAEIVQATDNFFEIGGHSLLAIQVISRIRQAFGIEVPLRAVFEQPTLEQLSNVLRSRLGRSEAAG